jgi:GT2 family glycosyltransferase
MCTDVIVVTFNNALDIRACISSILANGANPVVVDNGSSDNTLQILASEFCDVPVYSNPQNGYARAANIGFANTRSDIIVLSNADVIFPEGTITRLTEFTMNHQSIGVLGPQQIYPDGSWQRSWGPSTGFGEALLELVGITTLYNALRQILWPLRVNRRPIDVGYVDGAIMIVRRSVHGAIGGFDDQFPFSSEETDFCMRARSAGWRVVSLPTVNVIHRRGGSSARAGWSADRHAEAMLNGTRLLLQKYHGKRYTKGYFAIKQMFNGCMLCAISLLARLAHGQVRSRLVTKAAVHQAYCAQLNGIRHNLGIRESVSGVSANQCRMAKRHVRS